MNVVEFLRELRRDGIELRADGARLICHAPKGALTDGHRTAISAGKAEILEFLGRIGTVVPAGRRTTPLVPRPANGNAALSFSQERIWFLHQLDRTGISYNIHSALRLSGTLDPRRLRRAFEIITHRHEVLRTNVCVGDGEPRQVVREPMPWQMPVVDLRRGAVGDVEARLARALKEASRRPFDLSNERLLRTTLFRVGGDEHVLSLCVHHLVADGWSFQIVAREIAALLAAGAEAGPASLAPLPVRYADYAYWQRARADAGEFDPQITYWKEQLADVAPLGLPTDRARSDALGEQAGVVAVDMSGIAMSALRERCRRLSVTPFMFLLAAFDVLLARCSGHDDICVGVPVAGREREEVTGLVGCLVNTLVVRARVEDDSTLADVIDRVKRSTLAAHDHADVPFERVVDALEVRRELDRTPLFEVMLVCDNEQALAPDAAVRLGDGLEIRALEVEPVSSRVDLTLHVGLPRDPDGPIRAVLRYDAQLFDHDRIERWAGYLARIVRQGLRSVDVEIAESDMIPPQERKWLVAQARSDAEGAPSCTLVERIRRHVAARPGSPAVGGAGEVISYAELDRRARWIASRLDLAGDAASSRVAVLTERGIDMISAVVGILYGGAAYVPLDPRLPVGRLRWMLADCGAGLIVTDDPGHAALAGVDARVVALPEWSDVPQQPDVAMATPAPPDLAYAIYTSGSSGAPKLVGVEHAQIASYTDGMTRRLGCAERLCWATVSTLAADLGNTAIFGALWTGGTVLVVGVEAVRDPDAFARLMATSPVDVLKITPSHLDALLTCPQPERVMPRRFLVVGGEASTWTQVRRWKALAPACEIFNHYGPTETTVGVVMFHATAESVEQEIGPLPLGTPIGDNHVYVATRSGDVAPTGVPGELMVSGASVTRGYLGDPELTAEKFRPDPVFEGMRMYATGDVATREACGALVFRGRKDDQLKIRGHRVEPGEVQSTLQAMAGVEGAAVIAAKDDGGDPCLLGYYVGPGLEPDVVRSRLGSALPDSMVPAQLVALSELPLTPNGKLDRRRLPRPSATNRPAAYVAPSTPTEALLAELWRDVLGVDRVGVIDDFFALGGHSLLAARLLTRLRSAFGPGVQLRWLFDQPTIRSLARRIDVPDVAGPVSMPIVPRRSPEPAPLSLGQQRLWFLEQLDPGRAFHNMPAAFRVRGPVDREAFARALREIARRHAVLRTRCAEIDGRPVQLISDDCAIPIRTTRLVECVEPDAEVARLVEEEVGRGFDLVAGPLLRVHLIELARDAHVLLITMHHIVSDGWSVWILLRELSLLYTVFRSGRESPLPELPIQYADYAAHQRQQDARDRLPLVEFWRSYLDGAPRVEIRPDAPRPAVQTRNGRTRRFSIDVATTGALSGVAHQAGTTLHSVALAALLSLIHRYTGEEDICVGSVCANRQRPEIEGLLGFFANTCVVRRQVDPRGTFAELVASVRDTMVDVLEHQDMQFDALVDALGVERDASRTPLFQVLFVFQNTADVQSARIDLGDFGMEVMDVRRKTSAFDLVLSVAPGRDATTTCVLEYNCDLFEDATAERLATHYEALLRDAAAHPRRPVGALDLLTEADRRQLRDWSGVDAVHPRSGTLLDRFDAQVRRSPSQVAVEDGSGSLTYGELAQRVRLGAVGLRARGVGRGDRVAVFGPKSTQTLVAFLAIGAAGGVYVPVDPTLPALRVAEILSDAKPSIVVTLDDDVVLPRPEGVTNEAIRLGALLHADEADEADELPRVHQTDPAYVIYTSGSTGRPNGVVVGHGALANVVDAHVEQLRLEVGTRILQYTAVGFDVSVCDMGMAIASGGTLVVPDAEQVRPGEPLRTLLTQARIEVAMLPVAALAATDRAPLPALECIVVGGEACPAHVVDRWAVGRRFFNAYGPTEAAVCSTLAQCQPGRGKPSIGRPITNVRIYVLDAQQHPVAPGVPGELYIGGAGLACGYLDRPGLTDARFVSLSLDGGPPVRLYRSGDLVRYRPDGALDFLGRVDRQIKVRGCRIEPSEVEAVLRSVAAVERCHVTLRADDGGSPRLVAYLEGAVSLTTPALRAKAAQFLPRSMVPVACVWIDVLPLTPNGKVDEAALPKPAVEDEPNERIESPQGEVEATLARVWSSVLGVPVVGRRDNFFELGGDSILSLQVVREAGIAGIELRPHHVFAHPTVAEMAEAVGRPGSSVMAEQGTVTGETPLLPIQSWFFSLGHANVHHWNQAFLLEVVDPDLELETVRRAWDEILAQHDALRLRFDTHGGAPIAAHGDLGGSASFVSVDVSGLDGPAQAAKQLELCESLQRSLDIGRGPLVAIGWIDRGTAGRRIFAVAHHLVVDVVSWRILLEDLERACRQIQAGREVDLGRKTTSFAQWATRVRSWARRADEPERVYWESLVERAIDVKVPWSSAASNLERDVETVEASFDIDEALLARVARCLGGDVQDVLLAGLCHAWSEWSGSSRLLIDLESNGREPIAPDVDLSRTVGWLTCMYPLLLEWEPGSGVGDLVVAAARACARVPRGGSAFGHLRYGVNPCLDGPNPEICFNYFGRLGFGRVGTGGRRDALFGPSVEPVGGMVDPDFGHSHGLNVSAALHEGRLQLGLRFSRVQNAPERMQDLCDRIVDAVRAATSDTSTPRRVPLSPMQQGMLFHSRVAPGSRLYVQQVALTVGGPVDADALERAWNLVRERHDALRMSVAWDADGHPYQVLAERCPIALRRERADDAAEYLLRERQQPFDLEDGQIMRVSLVELPRDRTLLCWSTHHIVLDGWSTGIVLAEVLEAYGSLSDGRAPALEPCAQFWEQPRAIATGSGGAYWSEYLRGATPTPFPALGGRPRPDGEPGSGRCRVSLDPAWTQTLSTFAREHHVTVGTLVQTAWALLASWYTRTDDVVFGVTSSGRDLSVPGIERAVGMFIVTLPSRVRLDPSQCVGDCLRALQERQALDRAHESDSLVEIQRFSGVPADVPLFDTLVVVENYPVSDALRTGGSLEVEDTHSSIETHYPIVFKAAPGPELVLDLTYARSRLDDAAADRILRDVRAILEALTQRETVGQVLGSVADRHAPAPARSPRGPQAPATRCLHELVEGWADRTPHAPAVVCGCATVSYRQLWRQANALAERLLPHGAGPDRIVALFTERSVDMVVGLLGILAAGCAYLPLDPELSDERLAYMVEDAQPIAIVTDEALRDRLAGFDLPRVSVHGTGGTTMGRAAAPQATLSDLAYVIYTSGSTGRPKATLVEHSQLAHYVAGVLRELELDGPASFATVSTLAMDLGNTSVFGALAIGGCLHVIERHVALDGDAFGAYMAEHGVDCLKVTPSHLAALTDCAAPHTCLPRRRLIIGGEASTWDRIESWRQLAPACRIFNHYGPTEATVGVLIEELDDRSRRRREERRPALGWPMGNAEVRIVDHHDRPVPARCPGELVVSGPTVARGYLHHPELNRDKFGADAAVRAYRTGDLAYVGMDGAIHFVGRIDDQIKIRGQRVEPGEVQATLERHGSILHAAVIGVERRGELQLVAYCVRGSTEASSSPLRDFLAAQLPQAMIPSSIVFVEHLPLTPNGKLDRRALPEPCEGSEAAAAPRTPTERVVAGIWRSVLGGAVAGRTDDFFALGGHSLAAMRVVARMRDAFDVQLPLRALFDRPTLEGIAATIDELRTRGAPTLPPVVRRAAGVPVPASAGQRRLWLLSRLEPGNPFYNVPWAVRLDGRLHIESLRSAFERLVTRHEILRTGFVERDGTPYPIISKPAPWRLVAEDLGHLDAPAQRGALRASLSALAATSFDLERPPLLATTLLRLGPDCHVLGVCLHHIVSDAWSREVMVRELLEGYERAGDAAAPPDRPVGLQYGDYAVWENEVAAAGAFDEHLDYWASQLEDAPASRWPIDRLRPPRPTHRAQRATFEVSGPTYRRLRDLAEEHGASVFMTTLSAFYVFLHRQTADTDLSIGSPIANRGDVALHDVIGFFVNTLVLRARVEPDASFVELLARVRQTVLDAFDHGQVPFDRIVERVVTQRSADHQPLFAALFAWQPAPVPVSAADMRLSPVAIDASVAKVDVTLTLSEHGEGLGGCFELAADVFDLETARRWATQFGELLRAIASGPQMPVRALALQSRQERARVLRAGESTATELPEGGVHQRFERWARSRPDAVAVRHQAREWTYGQINAAANRLAQQLRRRGVQRGDRVAVAMPRSELVVVALLAIAKAGAAYVPIDPDYPDQRQRFIAHDSGATLVLWQGDESPQLGCDDLEIGLVSELAAAGEPGVGLECDGSDLAYICYTSGSTGVPKGVEIPHRAVVRLVCDAAFCALDDQARVLHLAPLAFDAATFEIWGPLANGGTCVISQPGPVDLGGLAREIAEQSVDTAFVTTALFNAAVDADPRCFAGLRQLLFGGERVSVPHVRTMQAACPRTAVTHVYGPTECTTFATYFPITEEVDADAVTIPIGAAIQNTRTYVLGEDHEPVPVGAVGELYLGGPGLAAGYVGRPELTSSAFISDPFHEGERLYKTGDLVRLDARGNIEFIGRRDAQIKVRGFRIELAEVEAVVDSHEAVSRCVVDVKTSGAGDPMLVAYCVLADGAGDEIRHDIHNDIRDELVARLPAYMVPREIVALEQLPLNANGKVDRARLPALVDGEPASGCEHARPDDPVEAKLVSIWEDLLGVHRIDVHDDFFELGGHSLLAAQLVARIRESFGVELALRVLFERGTVRRLAEVLRERGLPVELPASDLVVSRRDDRGPVSHAQRRLWVLDRMQPGNPSYNISRGVRLRGDVSVDRVRAAFRELVVRHESLRTVFATDDGEPIQVVGAPFDPCIVTDLRGEAAASREEGMRRLVEREVEWTFDLEQGPLLRVPVVRLHDDEVAIVVVVHHIVADGWSMGNLLREILALLGGGGEALPALELQYRDFAEWERKWLSAERMAKGLAFWREQLEGVEVLSLPEDERRPAVRSHAAGGLCTFSIDAEVAQGLDRLATVHRTTSFVALLTAFKALLSRWSLQEDICVGTPVANRPRHGLEPLVGFFVNSVPLRSRVRPDVTFAELLGKVRDTTLAAFEHQDIPFEAMVDALECERDTGRAPLFQVMFAMNSTPKVAGAIPSIDAEALELPHVGAKFDLTLHVSERADGCLEGAFEYDADIFEESTIRGCARKYVALLREMVATDGGRTIQALSLCSAAERDAVAARCLPVAAAEPSPARSLVGRFLDRVNDGPDRVAVGDGERVLTYRELASRADAVARELRCRGVRAGDHVGLCVERNVDLVVGILGILMAGAAYVPLDPGYPRQRLEGIAGDAGIGVVVAFEGTHCLVSEFAEQVLVVGRERVAVGSELDRPCGADEAYVLYTSGSTGKPKGVVVTHANVLALFDAADKIYTFGSSDVWTLFHSYAFDFSVWELWGALLYGGRVVVVPTEVRQAPGRLWRMIVDEGVTVLNQTPSAFRQLVTCSEFAQSRDAGRLRYLVFGGEALDSGLMAPWFERLGDDGPEVFNMYGITETTVHVTVERVEPGDVFKADRSCVGVPIDGWEVLILDRAGQLVPDGWPGEICVGGRGLAKEYLGRPELTRERFIAHPFDACRRLYRSGDAGRWRITGELEYHGRLDDQVKIRGYRIELGEVSTALSGHPQVATAAATVVHGADGEPRLVGYVVPASDVAPTESALREHVRTLVPPHMVPHHVLVLEQLPVTDNGKLDRRRLPAIPTERSAFSPEFVAPTTELERRLCEILAEVLGVDAVGVTDDFFALGGDSLMAVRVVARVRDQLGVQIPVLALFRGPTVRELAGATAAAFAGVPELDRRVIQLARVKGTSPLFLFPPMDGLGVCYRELARELGKRRSVVAVQAAGLEADESPLSSMEQIVADYVELIRRERPKGPYLLGGYSFGGSVAWAVARQLQDDGEPIEHLLLLDARPPAARDPDRTEREIVQDMVETFEKHLDTSLLEGLPADPERRLGVLFSRHLGVPEDVDVGRVVAVMRANYRAMLGRAPVSPYAGPVSLLRVNQGGLEGEPLDYGWSAYLTSSPTIRFVSGHHQNMIYGARATGLADLIERSIERSTERSTECSTEWGSE